jgi:predicted hydrocarbon binding protein
MMDLTPTDFLYPNKMGRIILSAMEEVLGQNGINAVLKHSRQSHLIHHYPPNTFDREFESTCVSKIMAAMEDIYGPLGGRGLALRSGRASFKHALREFGPGLGITDLAFRLLPMQTKISDGSDIFANTINQASGKRIQIEEAENQLYFHIEQCPVCWQRHTETPVCHLVVGVIQDALYWVSGGKFFHVEETLCIAQGDPTCTICIDRNPIE